MRGVQDFALLRLSARTLASVIAFEHQDPRLLGVGVESLVYIGACGDPHSSAELIMRARLLSRIPAQHTPDTIYIYTHTHAYMHVCMYACMHARMYAYMHACVHASSAARARCALSSKSNVLHTRLRTLIASFSLALSLHA